MYNTKDMSINKRIAFYRRMKDMRQEDVAAKLGMVNSTYSRMERAGKIKADILIKIAEVLEISPDLLFHGEDTDEKPKKNETQEKDFYYDFTPTERIHYVRQPRPTFPAYETVYTSEEEQALRLIHNLKEKNKRKVFEFINQIYKEERGE